VRDNTKHCRGKHLKRIAYLGPQGTYAEEAALALFPEDFLSRPHPSIQGTLLALAKGEADFAVVPIENSIEGTVSATLDSLWVLPQLQVFKALVLPIRHCLISQEPSIETIRTVFSHPQALAQCQGWLEENLGAIPCVPTASTVEALRQIGSGVAVVASTRAAELYNLPVLKTGINDAPDNCTRFWLVGSPGDSLAQPTRTSIGFSLHNNRAGALHDALTHFAIRKINLAKLESRPTKKVIGEYLFFADLEGDAHQDPLQEALEDLRASVEKLKILGTYPILALPQA
jgi:prephenate dehydratase